MGDRERRSGAAVARVGAGAGVGRDDGAGPQQSAADLRWPVRGDKGGDRGLRPAGVCRPGRGDRGGPHSSHGPARAYRDTPGGQPGPMTGPGRAVTAQAAAAADAYPRIVAALIRITGDWTLAEDCAQDALAVALERWPAEGVPSNPAGWLMTVARNRALDVLRRARVEQAKLRELAVLALPAARAGPAPTERTRVGL